MYKEEIDVSDELNREKDRHSRLIGRLSIIMFAVMIGHYALNIIFDYQAPWFVFAPLMLTAVGAYILNRMNRPFEAKIFGLSAFNIIIYAVASSETHLTNVNLYFALAGVAALVLFDYGQRWMSFLYISFSFTLYLFARFSTFSLLPERTFTSSQIAIISFVNLAIFACVTAYLVILQLRSNFYRRQSLQNQNLELIKVNQELDRFIYSTSHDLRAPISSILGLIKLSELEDSLAKRNEYLKMMHDRIASMDLFIREILDYAKNVRKDVEIKPVEIREMMDEVIDELKFMDGMEQVEIRFDIPLDFAFNTDPTRLKIILLNLTSNAIRYRNAARESPQLIVKASKHDSHVTLRFEDNGIGIPESQKDQVFDMFYRGHDFSSGSGLGLFLVKEAVTSLKGQIGLTTQIDKGSTFIITLPD